MKNAKNNKKQTIMNNRFSKEYDIICIKYRTMVFA